MEDNFTNANIAIIFPAYNEEQTVADVIESFYSVLPNATIWVINNCSTDKTESIARETFSRLGCAGGVINEHRPGKGNAVRRAFMEIDADAYLLADADMTYPASQAMELLEPILKNKADMVVGDRLIEGDYSKENKRIFHSVGNIFVQKLINIFFNANLSDIMSGYRAFNKTFVKTYGILVNGFEIETDMTLHALDKRLRIKEVPVRYRDRPENSLSKLNTFKDGTKVIWTIVKIIRYYKPLLFFSFLSLIFALSSVIAGYPVLEEYIRISYVSRIPMAILASGCGLIAILFFVTGLILDTIAYQEKLRFERILLSGKI